MGKKLRLTGLSVIVLLAACGKDGNPNVCGIGLPMAFPAGRVVKTSDDQLQVTSYCVERWAARLAKGQNNAETAARAAIAGCHDAIERLASMTQRDHIAGEWFSADGYWHRRALFVAAQTRAGNCYPNA